MPPQELPTLRAGLAGEVEVPDAALQAEATFVALMRLFTKDAAEVACRYATGQGRTLVRGADMRAALMYQARLFFQQDDKDLYGRVQAEEAEMDAESDEGESEGEGESEESGGESEGEESDGESEGEESDGESDPAEAAKHAAIVRHVDAIVASWPQWNPTDPVQVKIKAAIDHVDRALGSK